jgi:hypothetical protein
MRAVTAQHSPRSASDHGGASLQVEEGSRETPKHKIVRIAAKNVLSEILAFLDFLDTISTPPVLPLTTAVPPYR